MIISKLKIETITKHITNAHGSKKTSSRKITLDNLLDYIDILSFYSASARNLPFHSVSAEHEYTK